MHSGGGRIKVKKNNLILLIIFLIFSALTHAADKTDQAQSLQAFPMASQVVSGLMIVIVMILLLAWFAKRLGAGTMLQQNNMKVISSLMLGSREKAVLLEVENKKILVGVSSANVSCLHIFENESAFSSATINTDKDVNVEETATENNAEKKWEFSQYLKSVIDSKHL